MTEPLTYDSTGVKYDQLDAFKRACQREASTTVEALTQHSLKEPDGIRGESAYLIEDEDSFLAHVEEGLGTKNLVADAMLALTGQDFYANIGIDTVATMTNDLITCGALPISIAMHAAVGDGKWFSEGTRAQSLAHGFAEGCRRSGAVWGGGETPALKGIVDPSTIVLAGSALGRIKPKEMRILGDVRDGDAIILVASSGVQTNGLTLCRALADRVPAGYLAPMDDGRTYGEGLLDPSVIYVNLVAGLQRAGIRPHYAAHVTGHGWRKLMRLDEPFVYRLTELRTGPSVFRFIVQAGHLSMREAYATFNMGVGFALYVDPKDVPAILSIAMTEQYEAWVGGIVRKQGDRKAVEIVPYDIVFEGETLQVRT